MATKRTPARRAKSAAARRVRKLDASHLVTAAAGAAFGWAVATHGLRDVAAALGTAAAVVVGVSIALGVLWKH